MDMKSNRFGEEQIFPPLARDRQAPVDGRHDDNHFPPHTSLNGLTPTEFATRSRTDQNTNRPNL